MRKVPLSIKIAAPVVALVVSIVALVAVVAGLKSWWSLPFSPFEVKAEQPIQFPHDIHAGELGIDCLFCHRSANSDEAASYPSVQQCMVCHQVVKGVDAKTSPEVAKLVAAFQNNEPINWVRIHRLPDHVQFTHQAHILFFSEKNNIAPSQVCSYCHGDVKTMQLDVQVRNLKMRDCLDCHRRGYLAYLTADARAAQDAAVKEGTIAPPPTDCFQCHY